MAKKIMPKAAGEFVNEVLEYFSKYLENKTEISIELRSEAVNKIRNISLVVGPPDEISVAAKLEQFYEELRLNGQKKIVESYFEMCKFHRKLEIEMKNDWRWKLEEMSVQENVEYFAADNILCKITN